MSVGCPLPLWLPPPPVGSPICGPAGSCMPSWPPPRGLPRVCVWRAAGIEASLQGLSLETVGPCCCVDNRPPFSIVVDSGSYGLPTGPVSVVPAFSVRTVLLCAIPLVSQATTSKPPGQAAYGGRCRAQKARCPLGCAPSL